MGAKKRPYYRLVVADARSPRDGRFIEQLGTYDPLTDPATIRIDAEKVNRWLFRALYVLGTYLFVLAVAWS